MINSYNNFDPLEKVIETSQNFDLLNESKKREIRNILKSYTGYFDIFSEMIQNSLDACERKWRELNYTFEPQIQVTIDLSERSIIVSDNGTGMNKQEFEYCLAPNISFKSNENLRGNKGVGSTFLSYGFNFFKMHTRSKGFEARIELIGGKDWVDGNLSERPKFQDLEHNIDAFLTSKDSGTTIKVTLRQGEKPNLNFISATTADQWMTILKIKTALGGIYLTTTKEGQFKPKIKIKVISVSGDETIKESKGADYYFPHDIPNLRVKSIQEIEIALNGIQGGPDEKFGRLNENFKRLNAVYEIWGKSELLSINKFSNNLNDEEKTLIEECNVCVYGFFCNTTKIFDRFNDDSLRIRKSYRILRGGLQMATDGMPQGELITIPLTRYIGYQEQTHVVVHFTKGEPDLGRKTFQKEKTELGEKLAKSVVEICRKYRQHLKSDETSDPLTPDRDRHEWIKSQETYFTNNSLGAAYPKLVEKIKLLSEPQKEQDVVALFHELIGAKLIKGIEFYATSEHTRYDSVYRLNYNDDTLFYEEIENPLGISKERIPELPFITEPKVLEYKYDFDALVRECLSNEKYHNHINLVVAWDASLAYSDNVELKSILINDLALDQRITFGTTHLAYLTGHYERPIYEVIILKELLSFLNDKNFEMQNQIRKYTDI